MSGIMDNLSSLLTVLNSFKTRTVAYATRIGVNQTNFEHAGYAVLMQLVVWALFGSILAGTCFGIAFFLGREHAQFQAHLGYTFKSTFQAFDVRKWSRDSQLDLLFPVVATLAVGGIAALLT